MAVANAGHRAKRPYQASITSFFAASGNHSERPTETSKANTFLTHVPDTVQASLLSVGMRVRKAVPEGYKNVATSTPSRSTHFSTLPPQQLRPNSAEDLYSLPPSHSTRRELTPFCGLHKIGGYAAQSFSEYEMSDSRNGGAHQIGFEDEDMPGFRSSQESNVSNTSSVRFEPESRKRGHATFVDDEDELEQDEPHFELDIEPDFSYIFSGADVNGDFMEPSRHQERRHLAKPIPFRDRRAGRHTIGATTTGNARGSGTKRHGKRESADFGDATFLDRGLADDIGMVLD